MALIKLGALAQDVRGSLNGTTFSRNKGGAYARTKVSPVNPFSPYSANSRQAFKAVAQAWAQTLNDSDRAQWIAFAALHPFINVFGDSITLSGIAFYQAAMKRLQQLGFPIFNDPPATWLTDPPGDIAPVMSVDGAGNVQLLINPTNAVPNVDTTAYVFATPVLAPGVTPQRSDFRLINAIDGTIRDDTYDFGPAYKARFGGLVPPDGAKIAIKYAYLDTVLGSLSVPSSAIINASALPGPLIPAVFKEALDLGGGNISRVLFTSVPHGLTTGDEVDVILSPSDPVFDGAGQVVTVINDVEFTLPTVAGTPTAGAGTAGTIQHTGP